MDLTIKDKITLKGHYRFTLKNVETGEVRVFEYENVITNLLKNKIAEILTTVHTSDVLLTNYCAVGTGANVPAVTDTQLQTELSRTLNASSSYLANVAYISGFFDQTEGNGALKEAGVFIGGTNSANSGLLASRVAIDITKSNVETLTLDWTITIS